MKALIQVSGGLGNQLIQLYFAYSLKKEKSYDLIALDDKFYLNQNDIRIDKREYYLESLQDEFSVADIEFVNQYWGCSGIKKIGMIIKNYLFDADYYIPIKNHYPSIIKTLVIRFFSRHYYTGLWINYDDSKDMRGFLRNLLLTNETRYETEHVIKWKKNIQNQQASIAVCIRRGDFVGLGVSESYNYYIRGMEFLADQIDCDATFYVFSDDIKDCKMNIGTIEANLHFVPSSSSPIENFILISKCNAAIISRSTYELLAVMASNIKKHLVVVPSEWQMSKLL